MFADRLKESVRAEIEPVLAGMGFALVELAIGRRRGTTTVVLVIHRPAGVGIDECAAVSRAMLPRLELIEELGEVSLEVSSPGIARAIKDPHEYAIFAGRGVRVLVGEGDAWVGGTIGSAKEGSLVLDTPEGPRSFALTAVRKARLDHRYDRGGRGEPAGGPPS